MSKYIPAATLQKQLSMTVETWKRKYNKNYNTPIKRDDTFIDPTPYLDESLYRIPSSSCFLFRFHLFYPLLLSLLFSFDFPQHMVHGIGTLILQHLVTMSMMHPSITSGIKVQLKSIALAGMISSLLIAFINLYIFLYIYSYILLYTFIYFYIFYTFFFLYFIYIFIFYLYIYVLYFLFEDTYTYVGRHVAGATLNSLEEEGRDGEGEETEGVEGMEEGAEDAEDVEGVGEARYLLALM